MPPGRMTGRLVAGRSRLPEGCDSGGGLPIEPFHRPLRERIIRALGATAHPRSPSRKNLHSSICKTILLA